MARASSHSTRQQGHVDDVGGRTAATRRRSRATVVRNLLAHPLTLARQIALTLTSRLKPLRVPCLPVTLDLEPNNDCNFECPHCQVTHWAKRRFRLGRESFERILDQFPRFAGLKLQGMG